MDPTIFGNSANILMVVMAEWLMHLTVDQDFAGSNPVDHPRYGAGRRDVVTERGEIS